MNSSSLNTIRSALAAAVEETGLRAVARDLGLSPSGLRKLLGGTQPYAPTVKKLRRQDLPRGEWPRHKATREGRPGRGAPA